MATEWLVLSGAAIGAAGAIGGQLLAQVLTARRERLRAAADRSERETQRFLADKKAVFVEFLTGVERHERITQALLLDEVDRADRASLIDEREALDIQLRPVRAEIGLVAPEVLPSLHTWSFASLNASFLDDSNTSDDDVLVNTMHKYNETIFPMYTAMRRSLGIDIDADSTGI